MEKSFKQKPRGRFSYKESSTKHVRPRTLNPPDEMNDVNCSEDNPATANSTSMDYQNDESTHRQQKSARPRYRNNAGHKPQRHRVLNISEPDAENDWRQKRSDLITGDVELPRKKLLQPTFDSVKEAKAKSDNSGDRDYEDGPSDACPPILVTASTLNAGAAVFVPQQKKEAFQKMKSLGKASARPPRRFDRTYMKQDDEHRRSDEHDYDHGSSESNELDKKEHVQKGARRRYSNQRQQRQVSASEKRSGQSEALELVKQFAGENHKEDHQSDSSSDRGKNVHLQQRKGYQQQQNAGGRQFQNKKYAENKNKHHKQKDTVKSASTVDGKGNGLMHVSNQVQEPDNSKVQHEYPLPDDNNETVSVVKPTAARQNSSDHRRHKELHSFIQRKPINVVNKESHREGLIEMLFDATYECTICCCVIKQDTATWSCDRCYHVCHLYCIKKWANSLASNSDRSCWRCPVCQMEYTKVPNMYKCFCGKVRDPVWNRRDTPHSCGEVCGQKRAGNCNHPCIDLCHPGPCPSCNAYISKFCNCGRSYQKVKCSKQEAVRCQQVCNKMRNCGRHKCADICHSGSCASCDVTLTQKCHCEDKEREVVCGSEADMSESFSCDKICEKLLDCGNHHCNQPCHSGPCKPCATSISVIKSCPCGKKLLDEIDGCPERSSCLDKIPTCGQICSKVMDCKTGDDGEVHRCKIFCHIGDCDCKQSCSIVCRCKTKTVTITCKEAKRYSENNPLLCEKRCQKKRGCGRHKCGLPCCVVCSKRLTCGKHKCMELCHLGNCPTCYNVSFDELPCHCGTEILYPPIACGTKPPKCSMPCNRVHECEHPVLHRCHSDDTCPPCVVLTSKLCNGGHEYRNNIPCHMESISCGRPCMKVLPCGDHKCQQICHKGECAINCTQPCIKPRPSCGHPCAAPCHPDQGCPDTDCQCKVTLKCPCGERAEIILCFMTQARATKSSLPSLTLAMKGINTSLDISELMSFAEKKQLPCDENCAIVRRNKALASALEIVDMEAFAFLSSDANGAQYSDFLKKFARSNPKLTAEIEKALTELVNSAKQSKQEMRTHVFPPMKKSERQAVHELAELFCCGTISYDEEPQRNVVAMAHKNKCQLPQQTLTSYMKYEKVPRPPIPIPAVAKEEELRQKAKEDLLSTELKVDYFEMTE